MEGIQLPATLALLLAPDLAGARQRQGKRGFEMRSSRRWRLTDHLTINLWGIQAQASGLAAVGALTLILVCTG